MKKSASKKGGDKPKKRITWRQVSSCFSNKYGSIVWENVHNTQVVKIYTVHKKDNRWWIIKVQHLRDGVEMRQLNFHTIKPFDKTQLN